MILEILEIYYYRELFRDEIILFRRNLVYLFLKNR